jgi:hypothetical protein
MNLYKQILFSILFIFTVHCSSITVIPEPNLEQYTVKSSTVCFSFRWYAPFFCWDAQPNSILLKGIYNNNSGEKKYYLDYYLDNFDTDFPVGVSLKIDGTFYNLRKVQTDYSDTLRIRSEINEELIGKLKSYSGNLLLSYSNRSTTTNYELSSGESESILKNAKEVFDKLSSVSKMKIVK